MDFEDIHHTSLWWEHNWLLSSNHEEIKVPILPPEKEDWSLINTEKRTIKEMPLVDMIDSLGHRGKTVDYFFSSVEKIGWRVLEEILRNHHLLEIRQVRQSDLKNYA